MGKNITLVGGNGDGQTTQGRQPDHRRAQHRGGRGGAGVRLQGGRRSGQGAPGADGRVRVLADPGSARRAHGQTDLRSGLPDRAAPEGPEPRFAERQGAGVSLPNTATAQELFNACAAHGGKAWDHSGDGSRAGTDGQFRSGADRHDPSPLAGEGRGERPGRQKPTPHPTLRATFSRKGRRETGPPMIANARTVLRDLFDAAVAAASPAALRSANLPPRPRGRTIVVGAGKAAAAMAAAVESHWDGPLEGLVVTRYGHGVPCSRIRVVEAGASRSRRGGTGGGAATSSPLVRGLTRRRFGPLPDFGRRLGAARASRRGRDARRQAGDQPRAAASRARTSAR